jgi:hypothetical protein
VGSELNSINPETGLPEFGWFSKQFRSVKKRVKKVVKKAVKPVQKVVKKVVPKEFRKLFPKELRRINELEKAIEKAVPKELRGLTKKITDLETWKKLVPKELRRINELENLVQDVKDKAGNFLQKGIDYTPGLGGFGSFASRRDVEKMEQAATKQQSEMQSMIDEMNKTMAEQQDQMVETMQTMYAAQEESQKKAKAESDKAIMAGKVQNIKARREIGASKMLKAKGATQAAGEAGVGNLGYSGPRYSGRRSRKRPSFTGAAIPTLQIGGSYRPQ